MVHMEVMVVVVVGVVVMVEVLMVMVMITLDFPSRSATKYLQQLSVQVAQSYIVLCYIYNFRQAGLGLLLTSQGLEPR